MPESVRFTAQMIGITSTRSAPRRLKLTNRMHAASQIIGIAASPSDFTETDGCGHILAAHVSCTIEVTFSPIQSGLRFGLLTLQGSGTNKPQTAQLSGRGNPATLSAMPLKLTFGQQTVWTRSLSKIVTLRNRTPVPVAIDSVSVTSGYQLANPCGSSFAPDSSCSLSVAFAPDEAGRNAGMLTIINGINNAKLIVHLSGTGIFVPPTPTSTPTPILTPTVTPTATPTRTPTPTPIAALNVLITGGIDNSTVDGGTHPALATAEMYGPVSAQFSAVGNMTDGRVGHTATVLCDGRVLVTGGDDTSTDAPVSTAELHNPISQTKYE